MKEFLSVVLISSVIYGCGFVGTKVDYSGEWKCKGDGFGSVLKLERLNGNKYRFYIESWRESYDPIADDVTRFFGTMDNEVFIIQVKDNLALYDDTVREFEEGWSLYNEGDERCKVFFEFNENFITISTYRCNLIYAGFGVSFDGKYEKVITRNTYEI